MKRRVGTWLATGAGASLAACATGGHFELPQHQANTTLAGAHGQPTPAEVLDGPIVNLNYSNGTPTLWVPAGHDERQEISVAPSTVVQCATSRGLVPCNLYPDFAKAFGWFVGDHVRAALVPDRDGTASLHGWVAHDVTITLTPEHDAIYAGLVAAQADEKMQQRKAGEAAMQAKVDACHARSRGRTESAEVHRNRVLAEDAAREKRYADAAGYYEAGLRDDPCWPGGHYNAALLDAELGRYGPAASHMRWYLDLVPDARDAATARDKVATWDAKAATDGRR